MAHVADAVEKLQQGGITVSLFIDPDPDQVKAASKCGADFIEIHTGNYADAQDWSTEDRELDRIENAIKLGQKLGLGINAGHGLNYANIKRIAALGGVEEFNIGHSIISRAVLVGLDRRSRHGHPDPVRMKILVTNDDGINAEGLRCLEQAMALLGEVAVVCA